MKEKVGSIDQVSGIGSLERKLGRSSDQASGRVGSSELEGWLEPPSFCKGFAPTKLGSLQRTASETTFQSSLSSLLLFILHPFKVTI